MSNWQRWLQAREAQAVIDAIEIAPERRDVRAWRREMLGGPDNVLSPRAVKDWLDRFHSSAEVAAREIEIERVEIEEGIVPRYSTVRVYAGSRSPIQSLFALADSLREHFGWTAPSAAGWILTGGRPKLDAFEVEVEPARPKSDQRWRTIRMTIPVEIPPSVVADRYRLEREEAGKGLPRVKGTPLATKSLEACIFAIRRNDGRAWAEVYAEWEARRAAMTDPTILDFSTGHEFAAAARATYRKLTGRNLRWKRGRGERISAVEQSISD